MSKDQHRQGLTDHLDRLRGEGRLETVPQSRHQVEQLLELAHTNLERARSLLLNEPDDFDWQVSTLWDSLIEACDAALASTGHRVKGAEGKHFELTRLAAYILGPDDAEAAKSLFDLAPGWLSLRNTVKYDRHAAVGKATRDEIMNRAGAILSALSRVSSKAVGSAPEFEDWTLDLPS
jgi:hypothetical protein